MDITNPKLLYLKGALFVVTAGMACALLRLEQPTLRTALLLAIVLPLAMSADLCTEPSIP